MKSTTAGRVKVRGGTDGLNTKTSVSDHKYPPVRVIANTRLCVMSRGGVRGSVARVSDRALVLVCGVSEGNSERARVLAVAADVLRSLSPSHFLSHSSSKLSVITVIGPINRLARTAPLAPGFLIPP